MSQIEKEFLEFDQSKKWPQVYQKIRNESSVKSIEEQHSVGEARKPENRSKNRYRDVSPYDHSRVVLQTGESDYINASQILVPESNRKYILSQGPLEHTTSQFWQMIWEQKSKAIIMLNKVIEKGTLKCFQYWPLGDDDDDDEMVFKDVALKVTLMEEQEYEHYIVRTLDLEHLQTGESREVFHFHYTFWPDFGVPTSPDSFLDFLELVREHGVLDEDVGPAVIHCSAGIGRSGTFCLVDSALILVEKTGTMNGLDVRSLLLSMRSFRMGLIQTPEQLRFSYLAIIEGAKKMLRVDSEHEAVNDILEQYKGTNADEPPTPPVRTTSLRDDRGPPPPPPPRRVPSPDQSDEPPHKQLKRDEHSTPSPHNLPQDSSQGVPLSTSPAKPPRSSEVLSGLTNSGDSAPTLDTLNKGEKCTGVTENNNPVVGHEEEAADNVDGEQHDHVAQQPQQNSLGENLSGTELRRRKREERKKNTKEMIEDMRKKQKMSETWKRRKSYFKPIAIGLGILVGTYILYRLYW